MDDLISRAAVVDEIEGVDWYHINKNGEMVHGANDNDHQAWYKAEDIYKAVGSVPSAQSGCEDAVSRFEVLRLIDYSSHDLSDSVDNRYMQNEIKQLPSVTPKQRWIPWDSGKFPKESGTYTVTAYDGATKRVTCAKYQKRLKRWELTGARAYWRVLAWMEKPEPWKGGEE